MIFSLNLFHFVPVPAVTGCLQIVHREALFCLGSVMPLTNFLVFSEDTRGTNMSIDRRAVPPT